MKFAIVGEGLTDFKVLKNLLIGFFNDKNLPVTRLLPKDKESVGLGNVFQYLSSSEFQFGVKINDCVIVQIDTNECAEWKAGVQHLGHKEDELPAFIEQAIAVLIKKIDAEFYEKNKHKIIFAVCVHEIECWLLPFNAQAKAHKTKLVGCYNTLEGIAKKRGFSLDEKNYQDGKHYDDLSKDMKDNKELLKKSELNLGLKVFIASLYRMFPPKVESVRTT